MMVLIARPSVCFQLEIIAMFLCLSDFSKYEILVYHKAAHMFPKCSNYTDWLNYHKPKKFRCYFNMIKIAMYCPALVLPICEQPVLVGNISQASLYECSQTVGDKVQKLFCTAPYSSDRFRWIQMGQGTHSLFHFLLHCYFIRS